MIVDYDRFADVDADRIVERGRVRLQRRQDAQAREAGRLVEFKPREVKVRPTGPTCPNCTGAVLLTGNVAICNRKACGWQGLSGWQQAERSHSQMTEKVSA